jgi:hypothetical protein
LLRKGIIVEVTPVDRARLQSIILDQNSPQTHVAIADRWDITRATAANSGRVAAGVDP